MSKNKDLVSFAIIKGAANWRLFSIFDSDPTVSGVNVDHQNNVHNFNQVYPRSYLSKYAAKKACASLNNKEPDEHYGVCKII